MLPFHHVYISDNFYWHAIIFQVFQSGNPRADEIILSNMTVALDRIFLDVEVKLACIYYFKQFPELLIYTAL